MSQPARPHAIVTAFGCRQVGIALPVQDGFAFLAAAPDFELLDGSNLRRLKQAAAQSVARADAGQERSEVISVPIARSAISPGRLGTRTQSSTPADECL